MGKSFEIDIQRLIVEFLHKLWIVVIAAAVMGVAGYIYATTYLTPLYTASVSVYVNNHIEQENRDVQKVNSSDIYTAQAIVKTYLTFLSSDKVLDEVAEHLGGGYVGGQLRGMLGASAVSGTEIFQITITGADPKEAARIANALADMAPSVITEYIEGSSVKVVDYAKTPTSRSFPSYKKYALMGFGIGGGVSAVIIILLILFNSKISTEEDIRKLFTAPVIGKIPSFAHRQTKNAGYSGYRYQAHAYKEG